MTASRPLDTDAVLEALSDPDCRAILEATGDRPLTVAELGPVCELPRSTLYRKVDVLVDAGLLDERVRMREHGPHPSAYVRRVAGVAVRFTGEGVRLVPVPDRPGPGPRRPVETAEPPAFVAVRTVPPVGALEREVARDGWLDGRPD
jgi:DNA-binding transcriptional ArsR family regulator